MDIKCSQSAIYNFGFTGPELYSFRLNEEKIKKGHWTIGFEMLIFYIYQLSIWLHFNHLTYSYWKAQKHYCIMGLSSKSMKKNRKRNDTHIHTYKLGNIFSFLFSANQTWQFWGANICVGNFHRFGHLILHFSFISNFIILIINTNESKLSLEFEENVENK